MAEDSRTDDPILSSMWPRQGCEYLTQADVTKLRATGFDGAIHLLEAGIKNYLEHWL
jgi:hypothetical protein